METMSLRLRKIRIIKKKMHCIHLPSNESTLKVITAGCFSSSAKPPAELYIARY